MGKEQDSGVKHTPSHHNNSWYNKHPEAERPKPIHTTKPPANSRLRSWIVLEGAPRESKKKTLGALGASDVLLALVFGVFSMPVMLRWLGWMICWVLFIYILLNGFDPINRFPRKTRIVMGVVLAVVFIPVFMGTARSQRREERASVTDGYIHSKTVGTEPFGLLFGETGGPIQWTVEQVVQLFPDTSLKIEKGSDGIEFSTVVHDKNGNIIVSVAKNHWHVTSLCLDKNYSDDSLEVKDLRGRVVLQIVLLPSQVQLQGEYHNGLGQGIRIGQSSKGKSSGGTMEMWNSPEEERQIEEDHLISPMFLYPSKEYLGEIDTDNSTPPSTKSVPLGVVANQRAAALSIFPRVNNLAIPLAFKTGDNLKITYEYSNSGSDEARHYKRFAHAYLEYGDPRSPETVRLVWSQFVDWKTQLDPHQLFEDSIATGHRGMYSDTQGFYPKITKRMLNDIVSGKSHIFLVAAIPYQDQTGSFVQEGCFWAKEPASPTSPWAPCGVHGSRVAR